MTRPILIPPPPTTLDVHKPMSHSLTPVCGDAACLAYKLQLAAVTAACKRLQQCWPSMIELINPGHCTVQHATAILTSTTLPPTSNSPRPSTTLTSLLEWRCCRFWLSRNLQQSPLHATGCGNDGRWWPHWLIKAIKLSNKPSQPCHVLLPLPAIFLNPAPPQYHCAATLQAATTRELREICSTSFFCRIT